MNADELVRHWEGPKKEQASGTSDAAFVRYLNGLDAKPSCRPGRPDVFVLCAILIFTLW